MTTEQEKTAAVKADAFELGMHAMLKEAGCESQEEAEQFLKIAAELSQFPTKEAALNALKSMGSKAIDTVKAHPKKSIGIAAGTAAVGAGLAKSDDKKKKPLFGKK